MKKLRKLRKSLKSLEKFRKLKKLRKLNHSQRNSTFLGFYETFFLSYHFFLYSNRLATPHWRYKVAWMCLTLKLVLNTTDSTTNLKILIFFLKTKARGKTNTELREEFILAAGVSQTMQAFTPRHSISAATPSKVSFVTARADLTIWRWELTKKNVLCGN